MIKQFKNVFSGRIFTVIDIDVATSKYVGIFEFPNGDTVKAKRTPEELANDHYFEIKKY